MKFKAFFIFAIIGAIFSSAETANETFLSNPSSGEITDPSLLAKIVSKFADKIDWGNLARYADANAELEKLPAGSNEVIFIGASVIDYWSKNGVFFPGKPYVNRGIGGQITGQCLIRFRADVINLKPKAVVILVGSNDLLYSVPSRVMQENIISMVELARAHGIKVVLASLPPVCGSVVDMRPPAKIMEYNLWMKGYAEKAGVVFLDFYNSPLLGSDGLLRQDLSVDCLHPNAAGYEIMTPLSEDAIRKALAQ